MARQDPLDKALHKARAAIANIEEIFERETVELKKAYKEDGSSYDLEQLGRIAERHAKTTQILVELAPFFEVKQNFEALELAKLLLYDSTEFVGEQRELIVLFLEWAQEQILSKHATAPNSPQMRLI